MTASRRVGIAILAAIGLAFVNQWFADAIYIAVALLWFIPDRRLVPVIEQRPPGVE